mgnify:CR=1 FL=1
MYPEDLYTIEITNDFIKVTHPQENDKTVLWDNITEIHIQTTDEGPYRPDVWLVLIGIDTYCRIPQGNNSYDFEVYIESMSSTENAVFMVWKVDLN